MNKKLLFSQYEMTKHYPRSHNQQHRQKQEQEQQQRQHRVTGWYCKERDTKYLCDICGYDSVRNNKRIGMKYYFVNDQQ
jgi:hypothetical protein